MPAALMVADVVVMPSVTPEPFGRVALEAQAMGRPVIAFDHGGASESIIHEKTGWLAKPNDVGDLGNCIKTALSLSASQRRALAVYLSRITSLFDRQDVPRQSRYSRLRPRQPCG